MDRDRFMTAEEALEWGLIDRILRVREDATDHAGAT
jgi:ATP-dependent Clp protease protease subunit